MATINLTRGSTTGQTHPKRLATRMPYAVERTIDLADATVSKGSALTSGDIIQVFNVPAYTIIHGVIAEVQTVDASTALTFDVDVAGGDDFVDGGDFNTVGYVAPGANGLLPFGANSVQATSAADTVDMTLIAPGSVAPANGVVRFVGFFTDVSDVPGGSVAARTQL